MGSQTLDEGDQAVDDVVETVVAQCAGGDLEEVAALAGCCCSTASVGVLSLLFAASSMITSARKAGSYGLKRSLTGCGWTTVRNC